MGTRVDAEARRSTGYGPVRSPATAVFEDYGFDEERTLRSSRKRTNRRHSNQHRKVGPESLPCSREKTEAVHERSHISGLGTPTRNR